MKKILILLSLIMPTQWACAETGAKLVLHFFGSSPCGKCVEIRTALLLPLSKEHADKIELRIHDIETDSGFLLLTRMEEQYHVPESSPQELYFPDTFLLGYEAIMKEGRQKIAFYLEHPEKWGIQAAPADTIAYLEKLKQRFKRFTFVEIALAGLIDGINPCAIATIIFLISYLAVQKRRRSEIMAIGLTFTGAVFITYLLLGIGAFKALSMLKTYHWISITIRWGAIAFAVIVAFLCFRDALIFKKTGKTREMTLQLSDSMKKRIHKTISGNLTASHMIIGTAATGFLVTLFEAVCTGQVYLPTIVLMTQAEGLKITGWLYLIFYNFLFVLPLLVIIVLAHYGLRWDKLSRMTQKHLVLIKISMGVVLLGMAGFLAIAG